MKRTIIFISCLGCLFLPFLGLYLFFWKGVKLGASLVILFVFFKPLFRQYVTEKQMVDYNEFGMKRDFSRADLTPEQVQMLNLQTVAEMESLIPQVTLMKLKKKGSKNPEADLKNIIGMDATKEKLNEIVARIEFNAEIHKKNKQSTIADNGNHMAFLGNPGTGKTTIARIMTGFLYKNKAIRENKIIEVDGNFVKAGSQTAKKLRYLISEAKGGVLFIDEAYALMEGIDGREAIDTLMAEMENNRTEFVLILAGYTFEMQSLISSNPGFESRIKHIIMFPDYTNKELFEIFTTMAKQKGFIVTRGVFPLFEKRIRQEKGSYFGNARTVRNILDETIDCHAVNYKLNRISKENKFAIMPADLQLD